MSLQKLNLSGLESAFPQQAQDCHLFTSHEIAAVSGDCSYALELYTASRS